MAWMQPKRLKQTFKKVGSNVKIDENVIVYGGENISIGDNVRIDAGCVLLASARGAYLNLGSHIHIAAGVKLMASGGIQIGSHCTISFNSSLISASDNFIDGSLIGPQYDEGLYTNVSKQCITMQDHSHVTAHCLLLPGAMMLEGSVLGSMSMLKDKTKPWMIHVGIPARPIKERSMENALRLGSDYEHDYYQKVFGAL